MQYVNVNGVITTTAYLLGGLEESTGGVITKYLGVAGLPSAVRVGSTLSYLTTDGLGSVSESFDTSGAETATQLFAPYGTVRYAANSMPTTRGYTGQQTDVTTGLDYYVARYYDPQAGQFASADSQADGLSPYAYVKGKPETATDPTGHWFSTWQGYVLNPPSLVSASASAVVTFGQSWLAGTSFTSIKLVNNFLKGRFKQNLDDIGQTASPEEYMGYAEDFANLSSAVKFKYRADPELLAAAEQLGENDRWLARLGKVATGLMIVGALADGVFSAMSYSQQHPGDVGGAVAYGLAHAGASLVGGYIGALVGQVAGAAAGAAICGPLCGVVGYYAGGFVGGYVGATVADAAVDLFSNVNNPVNTTVSSTVSTVASSVSNAWNNLF